MKPVQLLHHLARERGLSCCSDGACIFGHDGGMRTNGGCQGLKARDVAELRRSLTALRSIALDLAARVINAQQPASSPWRSLKDDPPKPPTDETQHALLVRASLLDRDLADDRFRLLVPHHDRDNGNELRWFEAHLDDVIEDVIECGYIEWMEVPQ